MLLYEFNGKLPKIHPNAFIAPTACIIGDVMIGEGSSIWHGAVVRGDLCSVEIGKYTNLQDNCVVHTSPNKPAKIGDHVTVGHGAVVHSAVIESNVLVGINSVILDGAKILSNSVIGAGAVVLENVEIPHASLAAGIPARVVKTFDDENGLENLIVYRAKKYFELAQMYKNRCK